MPPKRQRAANAASQRRLIFTTIDLHYRDESAAYVLYHRRAAWGLKGAIPINFDAIINSSDPVYIFAFWLGIGVAALAIVMLLLILFLRQAVLRRERIHAAAVARWREVLIPHPQQEPPIPPLASRDLSGFLEVWNAVHEPLPQGSTDFLARVAEAVGLEQRLLPRIGRGRFHSRLVSIIAIGHIRNPENFDRMRRFIDDKNPTVSLCAARALMQIDPQRAVSQFVPRIVSRGDWSQGSVATILAETKHEAVPKELAGAALQASADIAPRLIRFLAGVSPEAASPIIRQTLESAKDERLISACLQVMTRSLDLDCVRPLLTHQRWHVRMQAAVTLGRLGVPGDDERLVGLLSDPQWWVRYRAAQALLKLRFFGRNRLRDVQAAQADHYARDIIEHVLKEQEMGLVTQSAA